MAEGHVGKQQVGQEAEEEGWKVGRMVGWRDGDRRERLKEVDALG